MRSNRLIYVLLLAVMAACAPGIAGCSSAQNCLPARLTISPQTTVPGGVVQISSPAVACSLGYGSHHRYGFSLVGSWGQSRRLGTGHVADDGAFSISFRVPGLVHTGAAYIEVNGSGLDSCNDQQGSCPGYGAEFTVR